MQLLDATLAMALTLAALATIVTIIMEAGLRAARMRKKNLVEVMKLLNQELDNGALKLDPEQRWEFISKVINNPATAATHELAERLEHKSGAEKVINWLSSVLPSLKRTSQETEEALRDGSGKLTAAGLNHLLNLVGHDTAARKGKAHRLLAFLRQFFNDPKRANLYDKVTLEHVLRRLAEVEPVQAMSQQASEVVKSEFNRLARKYEEFGSAVSASFKRYAQAWSIAVGVLFAVGANVDGLRIFESYRADADLVNAIIAQQERFVANDSETQARQQELQEAQTNVAEAEQAVQAAQAELNDAQGSDENDKDALKKILQEKQEQLAAARKIRDELDAFEQIKQTLQKAQHQLADLATLGVPLGWNLYPNCPYGAAAEEWKSADSQCRIIPMQNRGEWPSIDIDKECKQKECSDSEKRSMQVVNSINEWLNSEAFLTRVTTTALRDTRNFFQWLFAVIVTGVLVGLGAPFWFDVAKRLAQVRGGIRSTASDEDRMSANNSNGDAKKRKEIVDNVVYDAAGEAQ